VNISFFLTPKADLAIVKTTHTVRQAIERMENRRYTAVPVLTPDGYYHSTLTEGDLLWFMKQHPHLTLEDTEAVLLSEVNRRMTLHPISIESNIEDLISLAINQNFVPVIDGRKFFIGIVRRHSILVFFRERMFSVLGG
jgi:CBS domain-containing protein